uniref:Uncharacterized protein n=1 Tax=Oryza meridionalis TaxID=40149 RepID=A0A0E0F8W9_9ORYZ
MIIRTKSDERGMDKCNYHIRKNDSSSNMSDEDISFSKLAKTPVLMCFMSTKDLLGEIGDIWPVNISKVMGRQMVVLELDGTDHDQFARRESPLHDSCSTLTEKNNMASKAIKRKPYTADIDRSEKRMETIIPDSVREPLLGNRTHESKSERHEPNMQPNLWDGKGQERLGWMHIISTFIAQSVRKIGNALSQFGSLLAKFFSRSCASHGSHDEQAVLLDLSPLQV